MTDLPVIRRRDAVEQHLNRSGIRTEHNPSHGPNAFLVRANNGKYFEVYTGPKEYTVWDTNSRRVVTTTSLVEVIKSVIATRNQ